MIDAGADVNKAKQGGFTPLFVAAEKGHLEIVNALITAGVNQDMEDDSECMDLVEPDISMYPLLNRKKEGIDINKAAENGFTPLHIAAQNSHSGIVEALIGAGANVNKTTKDGDTALCIAKKVGYEEIVNTLRNTPSENPFLSFVKQLSRCLQRSV